MAKITKMVSRDIMELLPSQILSKKHIHTVPGFKECQHQQDI